MKIINSEEISKRNPFKIIEGMDYDDEFFDEGWELLNDEGEDISVRKIITLKN